MCRSVPPSPNRNTLHPSERYVGADASGGLRFPHEFERRGTVLARWPRGRVVLGRNAGQTGPECKSTSHLAAE